MMDKREQEAIEAYRGLIRQIGPGFHPDTPFSGYEPPITIVTEEQFKEILEGAFAIEGYDPYGDTLDLIHTMMDEPRRRCSCGGYDC